MKITFSFNQISQIQLATIRYQESYDLVRSYLEIPCGELFDNFDLIDHILGDTFIKYIKDSAEHINIRGIEIDVTVAIHAIRTIIAIEDIQHRLNGFVKHESTMNDVRKAVKHAKFMIDAVEW